MRQLACEMTKQRDEFSWNSKSIVSQLSFIFYFLTHSPLDGTQGERLHVIPSFVYICLHIRFQHAL